EPDAGVRVYRVVAVEAEAQEGGGRPGCRVRHVEKKVEAGAVLRAIEAHADLAPRGKAAEGARVRLLDREGEAWRSPRAPAVHVLFVEADELGPAAVAPVGGGRDRAAVLHLQRVGEGVGTDARLVLVGLRALSGGGRRGRGQDDAGEWASAHARDHTSDASEDAPSSTT